MRSKKSSRKRNKEDNSQNDGSESNDIEDISSQSFADSGDRSRKSYKTGRLSSNSSKKERKTDDDTEDYFSDARHRKTALNKKKSKSKSNESIEEILSNDAYDKDEDTSEHKKNKKRRKSKRENENQSNESTVERDSSVRKDSTKIKRKKHREQEKSSELPITEILKKSQEHRTKYEEPIPLPELTTDTIYVQGRNGFSAMKIAGGVKHSRRSSEATQSASSSSRPIKVAIVFQKVWSSCGFIFQGLLGGMAMLHFIFMETYFNNFEEFVTNYSFLSEIYASTFSFLIAMCIISTFDKFDLAHLGGDHLRQIFKSHMKSVLAIPLYVATFSLHQVTLKIDDKLTLLRYNSSNIIFYANNFFNDTQREIDVNELRTWQRMTLSKDALAVLGWVFVSVGNRKDMLLEHLESMNKYAENVDPSI